MQNTIRKIDLDVVAGKELTHVRVFPNANPSVSSNDDSSDLSLNQQLHLVLVVDVSGSMGSSVEVPGGSENHGFSILDLVKHSLLTIVEAALPDGPRAQVDDDAATTQDPEPMPEPESRPKVLITLIEYTDTASLKLDAVPCLPGRREKEIKDAIHDMRPLNSTNLWGGLKMGLDSVVKQSEQANRLRKVHTRNEILLFTDGMPNVAPPRGHVQSLRKYVTEKIDDNVDFQIRSYGFGYSLDAKLLEEIQLVGGGDYAFIPDAGFVGTIFIHQFQDMLQGVFGFGNQGGVSLVLKDGQNGQVTDGSNGNKSSMQQAGFAGVPCLNVFLKVKHCGEWENKNVLEEDLRNSGAFKVLGFKDCGVLQFEKLGGDNNETRWAVPIPVYGNQILPDQPRDFILQVADDAASKGFEVEIEKVEMRYIDLQQKPKSLSDVCEETTTIKVEKSDFLSLEGDESDSEITYHELRLKSCDLIRELVNKDQLGFAQEKENWYGGLNVSNDSLLEKQVKLEQFIKKQEEQVQKCDKSSSSTKKLIEFMKDLTGQCREQMSTTKFYNKWGVYYLKSLIFQHLMQKRNNFKDPGVLIYGSKSLEKTISRMEDIFETVEPPPASNANRSSQSYQAPANMSSYYNSYGPCFQGFCEVETLFGKKRCDEVKAGDSLRICPQIKVEGTKTVEDLTYQELSDGSSTQSTMDANTKDVTLEKKSEIMHSKVKCVIETKGKGIQLVDFSRPGAKNKDNSFKDTKLDGLVITPWHPIRYKGKWLFPTEVVKLIVKEELQEASARGETVPTDPKEIEALYNEFLNKSEDVVYNFMLEDGHQIYVNLVRTVTLGHGYSSSNGVLNHPYFANMKALTRDLSQMEGWKEGLVYLRSDTCTVKNQNSGLVEKMVQKL